MYFTLENHLNYCFATIVSFSDFGCFNYQFVLFNKITTIKFTSTMISTCKLKTVTFAETFSFWQVVNESKINFFKYIAKLTCFIKVLFKSELDKCENAFLSRLRERLLKTT